jgi:formylglycine-generating enzyme required for sulfatase activity
MNDETQHRVILSQGFWLADTACTHALWQAVLNESLSYFRGEDRPVELVSWDDVQRFLTRLNAAAPDLAFKLPTEAEWEYACRAGTTTPFWFGEQITPEQVNYGGNLRPSYFRKYRKATVPVKSLPCNDWGLYQMHGNVWEWCQDWYGAYPTETVIDPAGSPTGELRVRRGGSWLSIRMNTRAAQRSAHDPGLRHRYSSDFGFRLARGQAVGRSVPEASATGRGGRAG